MIGALKAGLSAVMLGLIQVYRHAISPLLPPRCRYYPTCSQYAVEAITLHGPFSGGWMAFKRILRCHPLREGGLDPVPPRACSCGSSHPDEASRLASNK
ncbi:membrane protein insertion efficiency factor YidD [Polycyclovorans algicola]|uniref:membrane protein insertion efficiency factor YidD n=1 Tax=Polycyclovorans algicola TaxID=616992 RepID=UPI0009FBB7C5|nr:membrane protein insertion efficiency factor YidD [Polycyclovorans algicola]